MNQSSGYPQDTTVKVDSENWQPSEMENWCF